MKHAVASDELRERASMYALGALSQHEARAFDEHLGEGCEVCREEFSSFQAVVDSLALGRVGVEPPREARVKLLARLALEGSPQQRRASSGRKHILEEFLTIRAHEGEWVQQGEGVFVKRLFSDETRGTVTSLYRLMPGTRCAGHRHLGVEECMVLEGDFHVNDEVLGPGDYHCALPGSVDETLFTVGGTTILIVGAEKYEPLPVGGLS